MKQIFFIVITLLCVTNATAQCLAGETLVCTSAINYTYDAVGNRIARAQYCYCSANGGRPTANAPKDSTITAPNTETAKYTANAPAAKSIASGEIGKATIGSIYPNPTTTKVTVMFTTEVQNAVLQVSNQLGQQVATYKVSGSQTTIDLSENATGIYLLTLLQNQTPIATHRVVKID
jgi:Secretion system C-terminal sorting domain